MPTSRAKTVELKALPGGKVGSPKYQAIFDQASDSILSLRKDGRIDDVNHAFEEMTGYLKDELDGESIELIVPRKETHLPERSRPLDRDLLKKPGVYEDIAICRKDGYVRLVDLSVRKIHSPEETLYLILFRDMTHKNAMERELITKHGELMNAYNRLEKNNLELKALQQTLVQAGKMAALGELAAGIAHELNQPLQAIRGYAQEIQAEPERENRDQFLGDIIKGVDKMAQIIRYLRSFTRKSVEDLEMADVHLALEETLKMLDRQFKSRGIKVHLDLQKDLPPIYANAVQLEQVFINLATNARDAIEATARGNGNLSIFTKEDGDFVEIRFKDDGVGMSDRAKAKAFNPFFTTKEVGKGMGLGLSLSYGILDKLHGNIVVESEMGKGADFRVRLPKDFRELA